MMISNFVEKLAWDTYGRSTRECIFMKQCVKCGEDASSFTDEVSEAEFNISGFCQVCQDNIFGGSKDA